METFWFIFDKSGTVAGWLGLALAIYQLKKSEDK